MARVEQIFSTKPGTAAGDELELPLLVENYESQVFPIELTNPISAIRFQMDQLDLGPKDLVPYFRKKAGRNRWRM